MYTDMLLKFLILFIKAKNLTYNKMCAIIVTTTLEMMNSNVVDQKITKN